MSLIATNTDNVIQDSVKLGSPLDYFRLMKPRVMSLVVFTAFVGYYISTPVSGYDLNPFLASIGIFAIALGAGASGVLNQWYDRDIDKLMNRTKDRPIPQGKILASEALSFGIIVSVLSVIILGLSVNWMAASLLAFTIFFYAVIYTIFLKRNSIYDIHVGSISGSMPPLIAYFFVSNEVDFESIMLFIIFSLWQVPHSLAITLYRMEDFKKANIVIMPLKKGIHNTQKNIIFYMIVFFVSAVILFRSDFVGLFYLISISIASLYWIYYYFKGVTPTEKWSKKILSLSILVIFIFDISLVINSII